MFVCIGFPVWLVYADHSVFHNTHMVPVFSILRVEGPLSSEKWHSPRTNTAPEDDFMTQFDREISADSQRQERNQAEEAIVR